MSQPKFSAVTSDLLSRKGEAVPSAARQSFDERWQKVTPAPPVQLAMPTAPAPVVASAPVAEPSVKIALRLTEAQHFRMRVAAAQLQVTRQALMSAALDHYLKTVCAAGVPQCRCLSGASKSADCKGC
ncbi:MAG: hypothetical protein Q7T44_06155 [Parvibaculum sp.]|nr:hypothetical protein [Parvibaculum sp.]